MAIYSIYRFTNLVNGKVYIGKTINTLAARIERHMFDVKAGSKYALHRAIRKYGIEQFDAEVIFVTFDENDLAHYEKHFIAEYRSCTLDDSLGYNMTRGGDGFDSDTAKRNARRRVDNGTHPWCGSANNDAKVKNGTHPFQGTVGATRARNLANKLAEAGVHNFQGTQGIALHKKQLEAGTHHSQQDHVCPHCQKSGKSSAMFRWHFDNCKQK
jgi:group I intron endonuclease